MSVDDQYKRITESFKSVEFKTRKQLNFPNISFENKIFLNRLTNQIHLTAKNGLCEEPQ